MPAICPINPVDVLDFGLFGDVKPEGLESVLSHFGSGCTECWEAVLRQEVTLEELRDPTVHPVIAALCRLALPPAMAPTVRLGLAMRAVQPQRGVHAELRITREGLARLMLEELLYRAELGSGSLYQWLGELEATLTAEGPPTPAAGYLLRECRFIWLLRRYMDLSSRRMIPPFPAQRAIKAAEEVEVEATRLWKTARELGNAQGGFYQWVRALIPVRMEGSGGTLQTRQMQAIFRRLEALRTPGSQVKRFAPLHFEVLMDTERERQRRGQALRYVHPDFWLYMGVLEHSRGIDGYPCLAARAARHVGAIAWRRTLEKRPDAGLNRQLVDVVGAIHPQMCAELVPAWVRGHRHERRAPDWLSALSWGDVETASEDVAANLAACWLVMHPGEKVERGKLPLAALTDGFSWKLFREGVIRLGDYPLAVELYEAGKRVLNLFAEQGGSGVEKIEDE